MIDNRIQGIRKAFLGLVIIVTATWQITGVYLDRLTAFNYHQELTAAYLIATSTKKQVFIEEENRFDEGMEILHLPDNEKVLDYIYDKNKFPFSYNVVIPGAGTLSVTINKKNPSSAQLQGLFSFGQSQLKQTGIIHFIKAQADKKYFWITTISNGAIDPQDWEELLQKAAMNLGVSEKDPRKSILLTRIKWNMETTALPILGVTVYTTQALPFLFILALSATVLIASNTRHAEDLKLAQRKEPWIVLDGKSYLMHENNLIYNVQTLAEYCGRILYYVIIITGAAGIGLIYIYLLLKVSSLNWWILLLIISGISVSFLSGTLAVLTMVRMRQESKKIKFDCEVV
jgi:hypothetical protein